MCRPSYAHENEALKNTSAKLRRFSPKATAGVPVGSFDRTLAAMACEGPVLKGGDGYRLAGDGSAIETEGTRAGSGMLVYCARCEGSHPKPDKGSGKTLEDVYCRGMGP